jgi:hypothetical protein
LAASQGSLIGLNFKEPPANFGQFLSGHAAVLVKFHGVVRHDRLPFHACARIARGRFSICHRCATKHSVLNFSVSVIAAENSRYSCASQRYRRKWDREFESVFLHRRVTCELDTTGSRTDGS